jgi:nitrous oxidase accessory protein NosD
VSPASPLCSIAPENFAIARNNGKGIHFFGGYASLDHCRIEDNTTGVHVEMQSRLTIRDSVVAGNSTYGLLSEVLADTTLENCAVTRNGTGIQASGIGSPYNWLGRFYLSNTLIVGNKTGLSPGGGQIISFGNNRLATNTTNGAFTSTIPQQ